MVKICKVKYIYLKCGFKCNILGYIVFVYISVDIKIGI